MGRSAISRAWLLPKLSAVLRHFNGTILPAGSDCEAFPAGFRWRDIIATAEGLLEFTKGRAYNRRFQADQTPLLLSPFVH
jgi:hypothetical protein